MSDIKFTLLTNMVIESVYIICVTVAAIHFGRVAILAWSLLLIAIGYSYKGSSAT